MRVITRVSHDDREVGEQFEMEAGEKLDRLLKADVVRPASEWRFELKAPQDRTGDFEHVWTRVAQAPLTEVAPSPVTRSEA